MLECRVKYEKSTERVGFEPTVPERGTPVFETSIINYIDIA